MDILILAAGKGSRMRSTTPKVLQLLAGQPLLGHVIGCSQTFSNASIKVVVGHGAEQVKAAFADQSIQWVTQAEQLGTGHAVREALSYLGDNGITLILYGDVPLITPETLNALVDVVDEQSLGLLTVNLPDPTGYGRIVRNEQGKVSAIVEHKDASEPQRQITEVNTGILAVNNQDLHRWLPMLSNDNQQGEYYLTDIIAMAASEGKRIVTAQPSAAWEVEGVNNRQQQAALERQYQHNQAAALMAEGVYLADPSRIDVRGSLRCAGDVSIDINCIFEGNVTLGEGVTVEANCILIDVDVAAGTHIRANSHLEGAVIGQACTIGPYARLRPGTRLNDEAKIGNFVETKKATIGTGSKVNHLSYVGDCEMGNKVNIGAGTITCNYDGVNKWQTVIEDNVFVGSNAALVAPVTVKSGATIGAGSTIRQNVDGNQLALTRVKQTHVDNWPRPKKKS